MPNNIKITIDSVDISSKIKNVLRRYFEADDNGNDNKEFDDSYTAEAAIDDIHEIVGDI